jgi:ATP-dependent exoDNAse (exonuclease V) beta subunit
VGLVVWFKAAFPRVLPAAEDQSSGAVPYLPASSFEPALPGGAVTWHCGYDRLEEARKVVSIVREATGTKAILIRNRAHLDEIVPALKAAGVRFRAVDIEQLGEKQVVQDLYALTRALLHLADRVAWLAVLRAPWCGLTLADLLALSSGREEGGGAYTSGDLVLDRMRDVSHLSPDGQQRVERVRSVLGPLVKNRLRGSLRDGVEGAWLALGGPACVADGTDLEDAEIFLDELERLEEAGEVDLAALEQKIKFRLYAQPDVQAKKDDVEIMTIHRAKGLEWDTVIVPGLDRLPRSGPKQLMVWKSRLPSGLLLAPIDETGEEKDPTYKYVRGLDKEADDIESGRLFYVAATRARQRLHLLACAKADEELKPKEPSNRALLSKIWWQAQEHFGEAPPGATGKRERMPIRDVLQRLPADFALPKAPASVKWSAPEEGREEEQIEFSWAGETARHVGTLVHRWLQRIADDELRGWEAKHVDALTKKFAKELERRGVPSRDLKAATESISVALKNAISDERGRWVLGPHPEARSEHRVRARDKDGVRSYVIDRLFRDDAGKRWIVDFKISRHEGGEVEAFLDEQQKRYEPQLNAYAAAFDQARLGLYFPHLRGWRQWD